MRREVWLTVAVMTLGQAQDLPVVFAIEPTVITDCRDGMGRATLRWSDPAGRQLQVRVNGVTGTPLTGYDSSGAAETGYWVTKQLELAEARLAGGTIVLKAPAPSIEVGPIERQLNVSGRKVSNCAVPCYFIACSLAPGTDPPGTYKPCTGVRIKASNLGPATIGLRLTNGAGTEVWRSDLVNDTPAGDWVHYERLPLYTPPNEPLPPGRYRLSAVSSQDSASTTLEIQ